MQAPRQDWNLYDQRALGAERERLRSLTLRQKLEIYESMRALAASVRMPEARAKRLAEDRWNEKLAARRRVVEALRSLDRRADAKPAPE